MSEIILNWLNDEVQLSQRITNFEKDFSNGYFFGELLSKYNQQLDFHQFKNSDQRDVKISNFDLLKPTFRTLKVKFDSCTVKSVVTGKANVASQLLYQLKMSLEKVNNPAEVMMSNKSGKYNTITPQMQISTVIDPYAMMDSKLFHDRLCTDNKAQKRINLDRHLEKFQEFKERQDEKIKREERLQAEREINLRDSLRRIQINKIQRNMAFSQDWDDKGILAQTKNLEIAQKRIQADRSFKLRQSLQHESKRLQIKEATVKETLSDIESFEENLKRKGLGLPEEDEDGNLIKKENKNTVSATATMKRIKEKSQVNEFLRKERDKRRRKMIVDQAKLQHDIEVRKREELILKKLEQQSRQVEKEIEYEVWRAYQCKEIIIENRTIREEKYKQKQETNVMNAKYKEEQLLETLRKENCLDTESKAARQKEIEISFKQSNRKENYLDCKSLIGSLIDLANICYDYQQQEDIQGFDEHFFRDAMKLFIEDSAQLPAKQVSSDQPVPELIEQEKSNENIKEFLAKQELNDYINGSGAWTTKSSAVIAQVPEDTLALKQSQNNYVLGDLISHILHEFYIEEIEEQKKEVINHLNWLPVKLSVLGYQFSGKKSLAACIAKKYGVKLISIDGLIEQILEEYRATMSSTSTAPLHPEREALAKEIESRLYSGRNISDELYVKLIMMEINSIHPKRSEEEFLELLETMPVENNVISDKDISELTAAMLLPQTQMDELKSALRRRSHAYTKGFVLLDFPTTYEQSKLLESALNGFVLNDERVIGEYEANIKKASVIVKATQRPIEDSGPLKPGLDLMCHISISKQESLRRALARRYDPVSKMHFHLFDNIPPVDSCPLMERLEQIREYGTSELAIVDKNTFLDANIVDLQSWYAPFAHKFTKTTQAEAFAVEEKEQIKEVEDDAAEEEGANAEKQTNQDNQDGNTKPNDAENQIAVIKKSVPEVKDIEETRYLEVWQDIDGTKKIDEVFYSIDSVIEQILQGKTDSYRAIKNKLNARAEQVRMDEEIARIALENDAKWLHTSREEILSELANAQSSIKINALALNSLVSIWTQVRDGYISTLQSVFKKINEQKQVVVLYFSQIQQRFLRLIQSKDARFIHMRKYQEDYNQFVTENPDLCEEDVTKEELHQRVEDLHDLLFDIVEQKREEALEERTQTMNSGWIEREMERFMQIVQRILQAEISRSFGCQQLIQDYYNYLSGSEIQESPEYFKNEIITNPESLPPVEDANGLFPRLEKLVDATLKLHMGEEEIDDKAAAAAGKKGGKAAPPPAKKEDKKAAKKGGKNPAEELEEKKEPSPHEIASKEAQELEKAIFRYRVQQIKDYATAHLKNLRSQAQTLYGKMLDWVEYTFKTENQAIDEMDNIFRQHIEAETKIQKEIQLNYVDVIVSHQTLNFLTPPPVILPAMETVYPKKFSISQLYIIIEEFRSLSNENHLIESRSLLQLLSRKTMNRISSSELPETWRDNAVNDYQRLIDNLDPKKMGKVNYKDLCLFVCLAGSSIATTQQLNAYQDALVENSPSGDAFLTKSTFTSTPAWFDEIEYVPTGIRKQAFHLYCLQNFEYISDIDTNVFDRSKYIKELLFYIYKDSDTDLINTNDLISSISVVEYMNKRTQGHIETYNDLLFT